MRSSCANYSQKKGLGYPHTPFEKFALISPTFFCIFWPPQLDCNRGHPLRLDNMKLHYLAKFDKIPSNTIQLLWQRHIGIPDSGILRMVLDNWGWWWLGVVVTPWGFFLNIQMLNIPEDGQWLLSLIKFDKLWLFLRIAVAIEYWRMTSDGGSTKYFLFMKITI